MDNRCLACGICLESCPAERAGGKSFLRRLLDGESGSAWICSSCWLCQTVCPAEIDIHTLMFQARRSEPATSAYGGSYHRVLQTGYALPLPRDLDGVRRDHVLPSMTLISPATLRCLLMDEKDDEDG